MDGSLAPAEDIAQDGPRRHVEGPGTPRVIVLGNEKGGTGKSTTAMHLIVGLMQAGHSVASIDVDARQGTLTRYLTNRQDFARRNSLRLLQPEHVAIKRSEAVDLDQIEAEEYGRFTETLERLARNASCIVIDTPGSDSYMSRIAHTCADTLITPLNDSLIDLDLLARIDGDTMKILGPSTYAEMVWEQRKRRAMAGGGPIDWIVMRNRLSQLGARNKQNMEAVLAKLAKRIGFRMAKGFGERVIFREMFLKGLTLLDLRDAQPEGALTMSRVAARQEVRSLVNAIGLDAPPE
ncbi:MAG: division plane positioning ATPase MipZ [Azospirillaceae bacterium]